MVDEQDQVAGKLDATTFPYIRDTPAQTSAVSTPVHTPTPTTSLRSTKPTWAKAPIPGGFSATNEVRPRLLVFIAGGMTYSEMRTCYARADPLRQDIILGSTHVTTPKMFMDDLKVLELGGVGSWSAQNGVGDVVGNQQKYYDMRYPQPELQMCPPVRVNSAPAVEKSSGWRSALSGTRSPAPLPSPGGLSPGGPGGLAAPQLQQTQSMTSFASFDSGISTGTAEKKKKFGLFKWH